MSLDWLPRTISGLMVADYISTSFVEGGRALPAFAVASAPAATGRFEQAVFTAREDVRGSGTARQERVTMSLLTTAA